MSNTTRQSIRHRPASAMHYVLGLMIVLLPLSAESCCEGSEPCQCCVSHSEESDFGSASSGCCTGGQSHLGSRTGNRRCCSSSLPTGQSDSGDGVSSDARGCQCQHLPLSTLPAIPDAGDDGRVQLPSSLSTALVVAPLLVPRRVVSASIGVGRCQPVTALERCVRLSRLIR